MSGLLTDAERCTARVPDTMGFRYKRCSRRGVVKRDGQLYCKQHDPEAAKARPAARREKWARQNAANAARLERDAAMTKACEGVPTEQLTPGLLRTPLAALEAQT